MLTHPFTPRTETTALYNAILLFRDRWEQQRTMAAVFDLCDAIERAEEVSIELRQCKPDPQSDLALGTINLSLLLGIARQELARVQEETLEAIGHRMAEEEGRATVLSSPVLPAGTILSCPQCEEGLYKVTVRASIDDLVLDDGTLLQPLNTTIPKRDAWRVLACPKCGGRYHKDGKLHTVQAGWQ
jgi:hypothetical protein